MARRFKSANEAKEYLENQGYTLVTKKMITLFTGATAPSQSFTKYGYIFDKEDGSFGSMVIKQSDKTIQQMQCDVRHYQVFSNYDFIHSVVKDYVMQNPDKPTCKKYLEGYKEIRQRAKEAHERGERRRRIEQEEDFLNKYYRNMFPLLKELDTNQKYFILENIEALDLTKDDRPRFIAIFEEYEKLRTRQIKQRDCLYHAIQTIGDLKPLSIYNKIELLMKSYNKEITYIHKTRRNV